MKRLIVVGLATGGALGMAGTFVTDERVRAVLWAVDGVGLILATTLLAVHCFREGRDQMAAGFLIYAIGESVMLGGTAGGMDGSVPAFAAGTALWSAALTLTCGPSGFAVWTRASGSIAAVLFGGTSLAIFAGVPLMPLTKPMPFFAYPFLVVTFAGWAMAVIEDKGRV